MRYFLLPVAVQPGSEPHRCHLVRLFVKYSKTEKIYTVYIYILGEEGVKPKSSNRVSF